MSVRRLVCLFTISTALAYYSGLSCAESWQQTGSVTASTQYDSNPIMSTTDSNTVGIWESFLDPSYSLTGKVGANELKAVLALHVMRSSNTTLNQDRKDPSVFLDWRQENDAGESGLSAKYDEAATRTAEINNAGPVFADGTRDSRTMSGRWSKTLSERSTVSTNGSYSDVTYKGGTFVDYVTRSGDMMLGYNWSEHNVPFFKISYVDYKPAKASVNQLSRFANAILGWKWQASDYLEGTLQGGESKVSGANIRTQGEMEVKYKNDRTGLILKAGRQILPSGLGEITQSSSGFVTVDLANGSWSYDLSERTKTGIDLGWQNNHYVADIINRTSGAWLQHDLNSFWVARTYYVHRISEQSMFGSATSYILGVSFTYTHPNS